VSHLRWGHNKVARVYRTILKLGGKVYDKGMGKIKLKKVVFVTIFGFPPIRIFDLIEINN